MRRKLAAAAGNLLFGGRIAGVDVLFCHLWILQYQGLRGHGPEFPSDLMVYGQRKTH